MIAGWVVWAVSVFLSVLQKEHFSDKIVFMHFLKINAEKEINKEIVFFKVVYI